MQYLREIWNFKLQNHLHWRMLNSSILSDSLSFVSHLSSLSLISDSLSSVSPSPNPTPYHAIRNSHPQPSTTEHNPRIRDPQPMIQHSKTNTAKPTRQSTTHEFAIHDPLSTTRAVWVQAHHGANEVLGFIEAELWNLGFFVCGFCWLMHFWLIYEVLGVWVDGLLLDYFTTSPEMKAPAEVTNGREDIILRYIILLCRYIILKSKRGK